MRLSAMGRIAEENWRSIPAHFSQVELGAYVIMPNHVHGIIVIVGATQRVALTPIAQPLDGKRSVASGKIKPNGPKRGSIGAIVGAYKMSVTRRIQADCNEANIWQRNYYEHIIRNDEDYRRIEFYIESNPSNWVEVNDNPAKKA
jgi:putative transposase